MKKNFFDSQSLIEKFVGISRNEFRILKEENDNSAKRIELLTEKQKIDAEYYKNEKVFLENELKLTKSKLDGNIEMNNLLFVESFSKGFNFILLKIFTKISFFLYNNLIFNFIKY